MATANVLSLVADIQALPDIVNVTVEDIDQYCAYVSISISRESGIALAPDNATRPRWNVLRLLDTARRDYTVIWDRVIDIARAYQADMRLKYSIISNLNESVPHYVKLSDADLDIFYVPPNDVAAEYRPLDAGPGVDILIRQLRPVLTGILRVCDNGEYFNSI